ncbi:MAG: preprotein translocase subunit SecG [Aestuariivirga sp.]
MQTVLLMIHLVIAVFLIGLIMLQKSEGGALGIGGSGGGGLFSSRGVGNTLTRATAILAAAFFATSIALTVLATHKGSDSVAMPIGQVQSNEVDGVVAKGTPAAPPKGSDVLPNLDSGKPAVPTNQ